MEIQNISVDFINVSVTGYYKNILYRNLTISNMADLKNELETVYSPTVKNLVVQYTEDQFGRLSEPRILMNISDTPIVDTLANIVSNHSQLNGELETMKADVELAITTILK